MSTFVAWLIANLKYAFLAIFLLILGIAIFAFGIDLNDNYGGNGWLFLSILAIAGCVEIPSLGERIAGFLLYASLIIALAIIADEARLLIILATSVSLVISVLVAIVANNNFDEIVSRRMVFRNSRAELFDIRWKYCFDRFFCAFKMMIFLTAEIIFFVYPTFQEL